MIRVIIIVRPRKACALLRSTRHSRNTVTLDTDEIYAIRVPAYGVEGYRFESGRSAQPPRMQTANRVFAIAFGYQWLNELLSDLITPGLCPAQSPPDHLDSGGASAIPAVEPTDADRRGRDRPGD